MPEKVEKKIGLTPDLDNGLDDNTKKYLENMGYKGVDLPAGFDPNPQGQLQQGQQVQNDRVIPKSGDDAVIGQQVDLNAGDQDGDKNPSGTPKKRGGIVYAVDQQRQQSREPSGTVNPDQDGNVQQLQDN